MRRVAATLSLAAAGFLLGGCVYNPYTGGWYYGYPYAYRYPGPYYPYGYYAAQPWQYQAPAGAAAFPTEDTLAQAFAAANVTRDGRLTRQQAEVGMPVVAQNFAAIDFDEKGYVTLPEVRAFIARQQGG
jgi:hypothetical protein